MYSKKGMTIMPVDPVYGVNDFNRPKVLAEDETYVNNLLMILFGKPGFYPSIPYLGMDVGSMLYMFEDEINTDKIKTDLAYQCIDFLPLIDDGDLDVVVTTYKGRTMLIFQLPIIYKKKTTTLTVGVTLNEKGQLIYQFEEVDENVNII
jgi:hypothetical protein